MVTKKKRCHAEHYDTVFCFKWFVVTVCRDKKCRFFSQNNISSIQQHLIKAIPTSAYGPVQTNKQMWKQIVSLECIGVNQKTLLKCEVIDEKFFFFDKN